MDSIVDTLRSKFVVLRPVLDERARRLWAATEARALGRGGISQVVEATGMSRGTVRAGLKELASDVVVAPPGETTPGRLRRPGGGRKRVTALDPDLVAVLERHLEPVTSGDPESPLRWTCNSAARLANQITAEGHPVSERTVNRLLHALGYSLQANRKTLEGRQHPDRDAQFQRINRRVRAFQKLGQPVVSVDTRKKELVGQYRNGGRDWRPKGQPEAINVHDFPDPEFDKAIPYGVRSAWRAPRARHFGFSGSTIDCATVPSMASASAVRSVFRRWSTRTLFSVTPCFQNTPARLEKSCLAAVTQKGSGRSTDSGSTTALCATTRCRRPRRSSSSEPSHRGAPAANR